MEQSVEIESAIKASLCGGRVMNPYYTQNEIYDYLKTKKFKVEQKELKSILTNMCREGDIILNIKGYTINFNQAER